MTRNEKLLYMNIGILKHLIKDYIENSINVDEKELKYIITYCEKAKARMDQLGKVEVDAKIEAKAIQRIKDKFEISSSKVKNDEAIWVTDTDMSFFTYINTTAMLIEEALENMKNLDKELQKYLKYIRTYNYKFFKMVEETADKIN